MIKKREIYYWLRLYSWLTLCQNLDLFRLCPPPPSLVGAYYLQPPDARAIFLHNDLLCNGTCSVTGGSLTYWGGTNGKDPKILTLFFIFLLSFELVQLNLNDLFLYNYINVIYIYIWRSCVEIC